MNNFVISGQKNPVKLSLIYPDLTDFVWLCCRCEVNVNIIVVNMVLYNAWMKNLSPACNSELRVILTHRLWKCYSAPQCPQTAMFVFLSAKLISDQGIIQIDLRYIFIMAKNSLNFTVFLLLLILSLIWLFSSLSEFFSFVFCDYSLILG